MIIKILGLSLISISLTLLGNNLSVEARKRHAAKEEMLNLMKEIERGIKYGNTPIEKTVEHFNFSVSNNEYTLETTATEKLQALINNATFEKDNDREKLRCFFEKIGKSASSEKELLLCREYIEYFDEAIKKSAVECSKKVYLYKKMGLMASILSVIILI